MIKLVVTNEKNLELYELEKVHVGENKFGYYLIFLPEVLNGYNLSDCEVKLIQIFEDNTSVAIEVDTTQEVRPIKEFITLDATAQAQTVTLSVLITHNGDVIGKTNQKTFQVYQTKNATPIDPREELDEIIAELRAENAVLSETVGTQAEQIAQDEQTISGLNTQVSTLTTQNQEQAATITRQNTTIDQLNSRVPPLEALDPINPSSILQVYNPESPNIGFPQIIVNPVTAEGVGFNKDYYKEGELCLGEVGSYNPFPYDSDAGIYFIDNNEEGYPETVLVENWDGGNTTLSFDTDVTKLRGNIRKLIFKNCKDISNIFTTFQTSAFLEEVELSGVKALNTNSMFSGCPNLRKVSIKDTLEQLGGAYTLSQNPLLKEVILPESLLVIGIYCFVRCYALEEITLPENFTGLSQYCFDGCSGLKTINFPKSITLLYTSCFRYCSALEFVTIENGFNCDNLDLSSSTRYSHDTILSWFNALADRTGETAYTLTIGTTNLNKMTAEEKAIATNKNWNLA